MEAVIFIMFIGAVIVGLGFISVVSAKQIRVSWQTAAKRLKLRHYPGNIFNPGIIVGTYDTHHVKISTFSRGTGKDSQTYTKFSLNYAKPLKFKFRLTKQNILHSFGKIFGMEDIETGDESFDKKVLVQGADHLALIRFLTAPRRKMIKSAMRAFPELIITDKYIEANIQGMLSNENRIVSNTSNLADLANILSRKRKKHHPLKKAKRARADGNIAEAVKILRNSELKEPEDKLEAMELHGEMLYIGNHTEKAKDTFKKLVSELPNDHQAKAWHELSSTAENSKEPEEILTPDKISSDDYQKERTITSEDLCHELFASGLSTFDATCRFEEKYLKKDVQWSAKLISSFAFSFDFVFKDCEGIKATFELLELKSEHTTAKIKAIVHFPKDHLETLKKLSGQKITFSGKLVSIDALMKNIFISEGVLKSYSKEI